MKRIISLLLIILICLTAFASCSKNDAVVLFFAMDKPASSFDPQIASGGTTRAIVRNCFEGLTVPLEDGGTGGGVAESWDVSPDGLVYTFKLRPDAKWHLTSNARDQLEGKLPENFDLQVTAYDFVFALKRAVSPETASSDACLFMNIAGADEIFKGKADADTLGVRAVNKTTLEIKLVRPQSNFPEALSEPAAMPCSETFFKACSGRYGTYIKFLLSNGPFYLSFFDDSSYRINKNPDYSGSYTAKSDAVWFYYIPDRAKLVKGLADGDYSGAGITSEEFADYKAGKHDNIIEKKNKMRSLLFNINDEVLSCADMRRAVFAATNPSLIADNAGKTLLKGFVPECAADLSVTSHPVSYNENNAAVYLKKGLTALGRSSVEISVMCESAHEELMRKLLQEWQRILGISVSFSVKPMERAELDKAVASGDYQIAFYPVETQTESTYEYFATYTPSFGGGITGYSSAAVTSLLTGLYSGKSSEYSETYRAVEDKISDAAVFLPVWSESSYFVCTEGVTGVIYKTGSDKLYLYNAFSDN